MQRRNVKHTPDLAPKGKPETRKKVLQDQKWIDIRWLGLVIVTLIACGILLRMMDNSASVEIPIVIEVDDRDKEISQTDVAEEKLDKAEEVRNDLDKQNSKPVLKGIPVEKNNPKSMLEQNKDLTLEVLPNVVPRLNIVDQPNSYFTELELNTPIATFPGRNLGKKPPPKESLMSPPTLKQIREQFQVSPLLPLSKPWGTVFSPNRVACFVPTVYPEKMSQIKAISNTWGLLCDRLYWVVTPENDPPAKILAGDTLVLNLKRSGKGDERNIWEKMWSLWYHLGSSPELLKEAEWFFKIDDDSFFSVVNFKGFSRYLDPEQRYYIGHTILWRWWRENLVFNSGICYALSRATLRRIGQVFNPMPSMPAKEGPAQCVDREGAGEDPTMGICLRGIGVNPLNTLDENLRNRFIIFRDTDHESRMWSHDPRDGDSYYWKHRPKFMGDSHTGCCSENLIAAHNYKMGSGDAEREYNRLNFTHNVPKDWDSMPLPPRPRMFLYDEESLTFALDEFRNGENIPRGQRVHFSDEVDWYCWNCKEGDSFWRKEFDSKYDGVSPEFKPKARLKRNDKR